MSPRPFTTREREDLFCKLAARAEGTTAPDVYREALAVGDKVTKEAYQNLGRRLVHRGVLVADEATSPITYRTGQPVDTYWLDEEELARIIDPDYPVLALPIWKESLRQIRQVPEEWWAHIRAKLMAEHAPDLFQRAIESYCSDLQAVLQHLAEGIREGAVASELARLRTDGRSLIALLLGVVRFALGLSVEAVDFPQSIDEALEQKNADPNAEVVRVNSALLKEELTSRVAPEPFVVEDRPSNEAGLLLAAVDGSSQSGVMSAIGEEDDFYIGHAPVISVNTSVGQVNRNLLLDGREYPVFTRLPEKPEDLQQRENKYSIMAKLFYPDLSDSEYMHSLWNAMDTMETRATLRVLGRWYTSPGAVEVRPADVVLRDGTVVPQDRDFSHYKDDTHYGEIVREMISLNWEIAKKCQHDDQSVAGVVKNAQVRLFAPILNWFVTQLTARKASAMVESWPLNAMNALPDQALLSRLLTANRTKHDPWNRTCLVLRPFHATTNYNRRYSRVRNPVQMIFERRTKELADGESVTFWRDFRDADPYIQMLKNVWYGSCFIATVPRLDFERFLPRIDFIVPCETYSLDQDPLACANQHFKRIRGALGQSGFEVSLEHSMFEDKSKLEILPELVARVHDTVKTWARELRHRVDEYLSTIIGRHMQQKRLRGIRVRPFKRNELKSLLKSLEEERQRQAGGTAETNASDRLSG